MAARILVIDIETAPMVVLSFGLFNQNIGINQVLEPGRVICFAAKWVGEKEIFFYSEYTDGHDEMIRQAHRLYSEADVVVHYNGTRFDLPHLRTEFGKLKLSPPSPVQEIDLLTTAKKVFRLDSNKLQYFSTSFGLPGKVANEGMPLWIGCMNQDPASWKKMERYNRQDVRLTEQLYLRVRGWVKSPHLGIFEHDELLHCPNCAGVNLERRGTTPVGQGLYQRYRCKRCGKWSRGTKTVQRYQQTRGI